MDHTLNQLYEAMTFLYGGSAAGLIYELLAVFRRRFDRRTVRGLCDALFLAFSVPCAALCFLLATGGVLRLYGFLLLIAGAYLARWAFQPLFHML